MSFPPVTVFTTPSCSACAAVKGYLERHEVPYRERDLSGDPTALADMQRIANVRIAPVTVIGERFFYGTFEDQRPGLEAALGLER